MKELKQAAKDYAEITEVFNSVDRKLIEEAFLKGAKFVNTWIRVEDELPNKHKFVLLKLCDEHFEVGFRLEDGSFAYNVKPTHWRYI